MGWKWKKLKGVLNASRLKERDAKYRYETMRENVNSLDNLLTLAKKEIQKRYMYMSGM